MQLEHKYAYSLHTISKTILSLLAIVIGFTGYQVYRSIIYGQEFEDCQKCETAHILIKHINDTPSAVILTTVDRTNIYLPKRDANVLALEETWKTGKNKSLTVHRFHQKIVDVQNIGGKAATYERPDIAESLWSRLCEGALIIALIVFTCGSLISTQTHKRQYIE